MSTKYVKSPHLPEANVSFVMIGEKYREKLRKPLDNLGIECLWLPDNPNVDRRLSGHADLSAVHLGDNKLMLAPFLAEERKIVNYLTNKGFELTFSKTKQYPNYPGDCALNICVVGNKIILNPKTADSDIINMFDKHTAIAVRQGYCKCSVCIVDERSIITSDFKIADAAKLSGIESLVIDDSEIVLDGFCKGFIGGASFKVKKDLMAFTGRLSNCEASIKEFLKSRNIEMLYLTDDPAFDIGSVIILEESKSLLD